MKAASFPRSILAAGLVVVAWSFAGATPAQGQAIIRPPGARVVATKPVRSGSLVMINTAPAQPTVTYGTPRTAGYVATTAYGSASYGAFGNPTIWGGTSIYPAYGVNSVPGGLYGTYGVPSYDYNYYGGAPGGSGTFTPGLTIGVGNLGFGPWTYVGPVY